MSSFFAGLWSNTFGLLVEDGALAIGIVIALAVAAAIAGFAGQPELAGWALLLVLTVLLIVNVYRAGTRARRALVGTPKARG